MSRTWDQRLDAYFLSFCRRVFRWSPAYKAARATALVFKGPGVEDYRCAHCQGVFPRKQTAVDHIRTVIDLEGWDGSWDTMKKRMSYNNPENLQVLCKACHRIKTKRENEERRKWRTKTASRRV